MDTDVVQAELVRWIRTLMPCAFARWLADEAGRLPVTVLEGEDREDDLELVSVLLDETKAATHVFVFPWIRTSAELRSCFEDFQASSRWHWSVVAGAQLPLGLTALSLLWETNSGYLSLAMGLAPLLSMPVTRRSPHVAVVVWAGPPRDRGQASMFVGLGETPTPGLNRKNAFAATKRLMEGRTLDPWDLDEPDPWWQKTAFVVEDSLASGLHVELE